MDTMRETCDAPADEVVHLLLRQEQGRAANALLKHLVRGERVAPERLAPPLRAWLEHSGRLPAWADPALLRQAEEVFHRHGPSCLLALFCAALPSCYASAHGVQALHLSARLHTDAWWHTLETAQLVLDVLAPGGLAPGGQGVRAVQELRLKHAALRHLLRDSGQWNPAWGQPLNQEDRALALLSLSLGVPRALEALGLTLSAQERHAFHHLWCVVGHVLGLDERLLPRTPEAGGELLDALAQRQHRESPEGRELMVALMDLMESATPGNRFDGMPALLMRHLLGEALARVLAVPPADWARHLQGPLRSLGWVNERVGTPGPELARLSTLLGRKLLEGLAWVDRGPERLPFRIPDTLRHAWDIRGWERA
jgi:hypothetical protein